MIKTTVIAKSVNLIFVIAATLFIVGCASSPVKFDVTSVTSADKVGILITHGYPSVSTGDTSLGAASLLAASIVDNATGDKSTLRSKLREVIIKGDESITKTLLTNWPVNLPPNPEKIKASSIVRDGGNINYFSTAKKNGLDVLLYINIDANLYAGAQKTSYGSYRATTGYYWSPQIELSASMIRSSDGKTLWRKSVIRQSQISKGVFESRWNYELEQEYEKLTETASSLLLSDLL